MLVMTRRVGEKIIINDGQIEIVVIPQKRRFMNQVKLGISADASVTIDRQEVYLKKKKNNLMLNHY